VPRVVDNDGLKSLPGKAIHCPLDPADRIARRADLRDRGR